MSKVGIIGSGHVAQSLAQGFTHVGHKVVLSSRNPEIKKEKSKDEIFSKLPLLSFKETAEFAEILVVAIEGLAIEGVFEEIPKKFLEQKIIIDVTNPLIIVDKNIRFGRATGESNGMLLQALLPDSHVVKAFNIVNAKDMHNPQFNDGIPTMLMCGNDDTAKEQVTHILESFGWKDIIDIGGIEYSYEMESYVSLWVSVAKQVNSFHLALQFLRN